MADVEDNDLAWFGLGVLGISGSAVIIYILRGMFKKNHNIYEELSNGDCDIP